VKSFYSVNVPTGIAKNIQQKDHYKKALFGSAIADSSGRKRYSFMNHFHCDDLARAESKKTPIS